MICANHYIVTSLSYLTVMVTRSTIPKKSASFPMGSCITAGTALRLDCEFNQRKHPVNSKTPKQIKHRRMTPSKDNVFIYTRHNETEVKLPAGTGCS